MFCDNCGTQTETKTSTFDDNGFLVDITPVEVCPVCGEEYYELDILKVVE